MSNIREAEAAVAKPRPRGRRLSSLWADRARRMQAVAVLLICLGIALRLSRYLANQSLYCDETAVAVNFVSRTFSGILEPLDYDAGAPVGFLLAVKSVTALLGYSEYSLRLIPVLAGSLSVILFYFVARKVLNGWPVLISLALFAGCWQLVNYSHFVKQYASDVTVAVALLLTALPILEKGNDRRLLAALCVVGVIAIWVSHPAAFVVAGIALTLIAQNLARRRYGALVAVGGVAAVWMASLAADYFFFLRDLTHNRHLQTVWQETDAFMPLPPRSLADVAWIPESLLALFRYIDGTPASAYLCFVAAAVAIAGCVRLYRRDRRVLALLLLPVLFALLASGVRKYPFSGRLCQFLLPAFILLIGAGIAAVGEAVRHRQAVAVLLFALLVMPAMAKSLYGAITQPGTQEMRPLLKRVALNQREGDSLLFHSSAEGALDFYLSRSPEYALKGLRIMYNFATPAQFETSLAKLRRSGSAGRLWVMFSYDSPALVEDERAAVAALDAVGTQLLAIREFRASAFLYDIAPRRAGPMTVQK